MTMATTTNKSGRLDEALAALDDIDVDDTTDASDLRAIGELVEAIGRDQASLAEAVKVARDNGRSWTAVGLALGVSRQAAHDRFAGR